nr:restriction endonuclease subunit S [Xenorhabdus nematophila]
MTVEQVLEIRDKDITEIADTIIPVGYKKTEVGVIPEDWDAVFFGDLFEDKLPRKALKSNDDVIFIGMQDLSENAQLLSQHKVKYGSLKGGLTYFEKGDVLVAKITPCFENGKGCHTKNLLTEIGIGSTEFHVLRATKHTNADFIYFWTTKKYFRKTLESEMVGSAGHKRVPLQAIQNFLLPCPRNNIEQIAIANTLSDIDVLISELETLLAKKQAIKTATMQQLLTGRTRLPQFALCENGSKKGYKQSELGEIPEDWEIICIKDVGFVDPENLGSTTSLDYKFDYISLEQIDAGVLLGTVKCTFNTAPLRARRVLQQGDVLISTVRPNLMSHYFVREDVRDLVCSTGFSVVRCLKDKLRPGYLYQHFFSAVINNQIDMLISGSNYPAINSSDVKNLKIQLGSVNEQTAIATILSDMDTEIQALEQKLDKTRQIKQGMMQELLTGKTRLI